MSAHVSAVPVVAPRSARSAGLVLLLFAMPAVFWTATAAQMEVPAALVMLATAALVFRAAARYKFGSAKTVIALFIAVASCHAMMGYAMAGPTSIAIWIGTGADRVYATAFLVVSSGLLATAVGYALAIPLPKTSMCAAIRRFHADDSRLIQAARLIAVAGTVLMFAVYAAVGIVPFLVESFARARYLSGAGDEYVLFEWLAARALDLLTFGVPLVLLSALWRRRKLDWAISALAIVALLLPLRRANLLTAVFLVLIVGALHAGKLSYRRIAVVGALVTAYGLSQLLFVSFNSLDQLDVDRAVVIAAGALPEIRDLGWTIELLGNERLFGQTFVQALVPIPSFLSDFSQTSSLRAITSRMIGLDMQRQTGGLRLTLAGEAYLNFDLFGPVLVGALFGLLCATVEVAFLELRSRRALWAYFSAALFFVWTCFWLYLGGTQSAATIKIGSILLVASLWWARRRTARTSIPGATA